MLARVAKRTLMVSVDLQDIKDDLRSIKRILLELQDDLVPRKRLRRSETPTPHKDGQGSRSEASQGGSSGGESETSDSEESILSLEEGSDRDPEEDRDEESRQMASDEEKQEEAKVRLCKTHN